MKNKYLFFLLFAGFAANAQPCIVPPPLGMNPVFAFDDDDDGIAVFDIPYYIEYELRPNLEQIYGVSSEGYDYIFQGPDGPIVPAPMYTNTEPGEIRDIVFEYTGTGPTFDPLPPCFWPVLFFDTVILYPVAPGDDFDNDGISNLAEDTNNNGNLMDDDDDSDGIINVADATFSLGVQEANRHDFRVYPNPVTGSQIHFESDRAVTSVTIYDSLGRKIGTGKITGNSVDLDELAPGTYLMEFLSGDIPITKKIVVE